MSTRTRIGAAIRAERQARGMDQKSLARQAGLSPQYINDIELGRRLPPFDTVLDIANVFVNQDPSEWLLLLWRDSWGTSIAETMRAAAVAASRAAGR